MQTTMIIHTGRMRHRRGPPPQRGQTSQHITLVAGQADPILKDITAFRRVRRLSDQQQPRKVEPGQTFDLCPFFRPADHGDVGHCRILAFRSEGNSVRWRRRPAHRYGPA